MPKMKTHKGASKRIRFTGTGIMVHAHERRGHFRRRKATRLLQQLDRMLPLHPTKKRLIQKALPYGKQ
ncbi:MAG TPA: bL35 family ribosomal protein [Roseiflexaceae bacterium]|jgi:large subunit ribosomal protein L35|nr:bL35 family ribosomal protein [Roseiflexaceae bacterium]